jgi:Na+/H+ antiporter NhaD/arsenite permease-like protein
LLIYLTGDLYATQYSVIILVFVFLLIAIRQAGGYSFRIWQVMLGGACAVVLTGEISLSDAIHAVNIDVMIFLFGMFVVGEAVFASGYLAWTVDRVCRVAETKDHLLLILIIMMAAASAVFMNDTVAIIGTPLVLSLACRYRIPPSAILLTLCFALTTGSVTSPIGNPQNLLIAMYWDPAEPFLAFASGLFIPTVASLGLVYFCMRGRFLREDNQVFQFPDLSSHPDRQLQQVTGFSLFLFFTLIAIHIIGAPVGDLAQFPLGIIALVSSLPVLIGTRQRFEILLSVDWKTLIFFAAMFVLMQSVYNCGWFQNLVPFSRLTTIPMLLTLSIILSQFISNVPFVALFEPVIASSGISTGGMLALAAGSTIAGNLTILGAASNVIVLQQAEKFGISITFRDFFMIGLPLTFMQAMVYLLFLTVFTIPL